MIRPARTPSWSSTAVQRLGAGRIRAIISAIATRATAVAVTVSTYERRDAPCKAGPIRRLVLSRTVSVPEYNRSASRLLGHASCQNRCRYVNNATEPDKVNALSASVRVKPCQRTRVVLDTAPVAAVTANAIGVDTRPGKRPRITPATPRTNGPSHRNSGASCDAGTGIERPRNGANPAINPAAPRHMLAATAAAVRAVPHIPRTGEVLMLSYN